MFLKNANFKFSKVIRSYKIESKVVNFQYIAEDLVL